MERDSGRHIGAVLTVNEDGLKIVKIRIGKARYEQLSEGRRVHRPTHGAIIAVVGLIGPFYAGFTKAIGQHVPDYPDERWMGSIVWAVIGIVLVFAAKPLGRLLGRGLE